LSKNKIPTQLEFAKLGNVMPATLRKNVAILLRMVIKDGWTIDEDFMEKTRLITDD